MEQADQKCPKCGADMVPHKNLTIFECGTEIRVRTFQSADCHVRQLEQENERLRSKVSQFDAIIAAVVATEPHADGPAPTVEALLDKVKENQRLRAELQKKKAEFQIDLASMTDDEIREFDEAHGNMAEEMARPINAASTSLAANSGL